jgi:hypothetical protein
MRNLTLTSKFCHDVPTEGLVSTTVDLETNTLYAASEKRQDDGLVQVEIYAVQVGVEAHKPDVSHLHPISTNTNADLDEMKGSCQTGLPI